jgi:tetratricopeptide (TPR) repeat protein
MAAPLLTLARLTRLITRLALLLVLSLALPAQADEATERAALETLFAQLRVAPDETAARQLSQAIWTVWTQPSDPDLALRMADVLEARLLRGAETTIDLLDALIADYPDYAEGWNQRATMHYVTGDFEASIADCDRTLELEPRHFGALSGRALIYLQLGQRSLALRDIQAALALNPWLAERALFPELAEPAVRT